MERTSLGIFVSLVHNAIAISNYFALQDMWISTIKDYVFEMNNWETHQVKFMPSEGLEKNETSVRVLDHDLQKMSV